MLFYLLIVSKLIDILRPRDILLLICDSEAYFIIFLYRLLRLYYVAEKGVDLNFNGATLYALSHYNISL